MSLEESERLNEILVFQQKIAIELKQLKEALQDFKDELNDTIADNGKEVTEKLHAIEAYQKNILEPNQRKLYNMLLELAGKEEVESPSPEPKT